MVYYASGGTKVYFTKPCIEPTFNDKDKGYCHAGRAPHRSIFTLFNDSYILLVRGRAPHRSIFTLFNDSYILLVRGYTGV